jgi:hypothetical protein
MLMSLYSVDRSPKVILKHRNNFVLAKGFVNASAAISSVGQYATSTLPVLAKYRM